MLCPPTIFIPLLPEGGCFVSYKNFVKLTNCPPMAAIARLSGHCMLFQNWIKKRTTFQIPEELARARSFLLEKNFSGDIKKIKPKNMKIARTAIISPWILTIKSHLATSIRNLKKNNMFLILTYLMLFRYIRMEKSKNWIYDDVLFCKSSLSKMASVKTNKIKNQTELWKTNFLRYTTLLLGPKGFVNSKGPKIAVCLC